MPPIFEYKCISCGSIVEELRPSSDRENPASCEKCGAEAKRCFSAFGIISKASVSSKRKPSRDALVIDGATITGATHAAVRLGGPAVIRNLKVGKGTPVAVSIKPGTKGVIIEQTDFSNVDVPIEISEDRCDPR